MKKRFNQNEYLRPFSISHFSCLFHLLVQKHFDHAQFFLTMFNIFEYIQIFLTMVKSEILPFKLAKLFECSQKYLNIVKKYLNMVKKYLN